MVSVDYTAIAKKVEKDFPIMMKTLATSDLPRSAHQFAALKPAPVADFKPTHRRIETGALLELLSDGPVVFTYPTMYPQVLVRDDTGQQFVISFEVWDQRNKKKKLVNYEPLATE